jgi:urea transport system permease protein
VLERLRARPVRCTSATLLITVYGKYLCYAVLALGVNLLWGYTGILSLGHALFFSLGGYALGMHLMLMIGKLGQYQADIPDFMVFLEFPKRFPETGGLPPHWIPFNTSGSPPPWSSSYRPSSGDTSSAGWPSARASKGVYFSILSQALTYAACLMFFRNDFTFGGNNGLTDFKFILGYDINAADQTMALYIVPASFLLMLTYRFCRWLTSTKFGLIQRAIRDSENRVLFLRLRHRPISNSSSSCVAAIISGLGGALFVPQVGIINPSEMAPDKSLEAVVWVAVGGRGNMLGPILGAIGINASRATPRTRSPSNGLYIIGGLFIFVTLFMPKGIIGLPDNGRGETPPGREGRAVDPPVPSPDRAQRRCSKMIRHPQPQRNLSHPKSFILLLEGVTKAFDGFKAINELNFYLDEGELRVIIGPNGAGKSTMLDIITGSHPPRPGKGRVRTKTPISPSSTSIRSTASASGASFRRRPFTSITPSSRTSGSR